MKSEPVVIQSIEVIVPKYIVGFAFKPLIVNKLFDIQKYLRGTEKYKKIIENVKLEVSEISIVSWKGQSDVVKVILTFPMVYMEGLFQWDYEHCAIVIFNLLAEIIPDTCDTYQEQDLALHGVMHTSGGAYSLGYNTLDRHDDILINYNKFLTREYRNHIRYV